MTAKVGGIPGSLTNTGRVSPTVASVFEILNNVNFYLLNFLKT